MASIIKMAADFSAKQRRKKAILAQLRKLRPGTNLSIDVKDDPVTSRAVIELLKDHPEYETLTFGASITIGPKVGFAGTITPEARAHLHAKGVAFAAAEAAALGDAFPDYSVPKEEKVNG